MVYMRSLVDIHNHIASSLDIDTMLAYYNLQYLVLPCKYNR